VAQPDSREHFVEALNGLAAPARRFYIYDEQFVPDVILYHLALDVLEHGRAVSHLIDLGIGRPAWTNCRAAFESARDMLVLAAKPDEYCALGARARVHELLDIERLHDRQRKADEALGNGSRSKRRPAEEVIEDEAKLWDGYSAGKGNLLRDALGELRNQRPGPHWSGLANVAIRSRIAEMSAEGTGVSEMMDAMYGILSMHSHPGARTGLRETTVKPDGTLFVEPRKVDLKAPLGYMAMSAQLALIALERRPQGEISQISRHT
jgi:hypothetical protein